MKSRILKKKGKQMIRNKGITLIALVITIIVLLILAGVSIATLTGENGILTQASKAGEKTKMADAEEQVKLAVLASYDDAGKLNLDQLNENLSKIEGLKYNGKGIEPKGENRLTGLPDTVNVDGYDIFIDNTGETVAEDMNTPREEKPNEPVILSGMTKIMFTEPTESAIGEVIKEGEEGFKEDSWYNYTEKRWANVETKYEDMEEGSMWVWIPRYAYKVNEEDQTFDIKFLIGTTDYYYDENGKRQKAERITSKNDTADTKNKYYVHPAFTDESDSKIEYANGGWDKELKGIWVAKFEAGYVGGNISKFEDGATSEETEAKATDLKYSQSTVYGGKIETEKGEKDGNVTARNWLDGVYGANSTTIKYPVFTGTTYSMNYINHNDAFLLAKKISASGNPYNLPTTADSHLMKDSEWGAVAYLGQSKYGLGSNEVCINNVTLNSGGKKRESNDGKSGVDSVYAVTGLTSETVVKGTSEETNDVGASAKEVVSQINNISGNTATATGEIYTWNQESGQKASSSGTIYGIYDLSGGLLERTAAYTANGDGSLTSYGESLLYKESKTDETSSKYTIVYAHSSEDKNETVIGKDELSRKNYDMVANKRRFGNAMAETSTAGTGSTSWHKDISYFVGLSYPFSVRGGSWYDSSNAGLFYFNRSGGNSHFITRLPSSFGWGVEL